MRTDYLYCSVNVKTVRDAFTVNVHLVCVRVCVGGWGGGGGGEGNLEKTCRPDLEILTLFQTK